MLNAASANGPREIQIGLPSADVNVLENGLPVTYATNPHSVNTIWRGDASLSHQGLLKIAETAITTGKIDEALFTTELSQKFSTSTFRLGVNEWFYHIDYCSNTTMYDQSVNFGFTGFHLHRSASFEIEADVTLDANGIAGIEISNNKRERTMIYFDMKQGKVVMDRTESGLTDFGKQAVPHDIELAWDKQRAAEGKEPARIANSINYKNDFALATWAPLSLCEDGKKTYHVDIFVDKSSVELFVDGGRIAMTNLVFPVAPYENVKLYTQGGKAEFKNLKVHKLGL